MTPATDVMTATFPKTPRINKFREIARTEKVGRVDGYDVDPHTAFIVCSVWDAVKPANQQALSELSTRDLIAISIQMVS